VQECTGALAFSAFSPQDLANSALKAVDSRERQEQCKGREDEAGPYFWVGGVEGFGVGAGCVLTGCDFKPWSTEVGPLRLDA
jgi:hypothetical protein